MNDITIIMLTPNRLPKLWAKYHREILTEAIGDTSIITISKEPKDVEFISNAVRKYL